MVEMFMTTMVVLLMAMVRMASAMLGGVVDDGDCDDDDGQSMYDGDTDEDDAYASVWERHFILADPYTAPAARASTPGSALRIVG